MDVEVRSPQDVIDIIKRRKWSFVLPSAGIVLFAAIVALLLPPVYKSSSTILIEEQEIPHDFVTTTVTGYAEERLQSINQRIMSATRLLEIINRFNLYAELKDRLTTEEIINKFRKAIRFETISANVIDRRTGRTSTATIAFSLAYEGKNPKTVQQVANILASLYLEENFKVREQKAEGTSRFLEEEMAQLEASLALIDGNISAFKKENIDSLPELYQVNLQSIDRIDRDIDSLNAHLRTLKEREAFFQGTIGSTSQTRLQELLVQLENLKRSYSDEYPDVIKIKGEIASLKKLLKDPTAAMTEKTDNPAYVAMAGQLASTQAEIKLVNQQIRQLSAKRDLYRRRIEATPKVEENYKSLAVRRNNLQAKYDDLMKKYMEAKVAQGLEKDQMGERFTMIDAPRLPEKPVRPNRPAIFLIGIVLGVGCGIGLVALRESLDHAVRTAATLARETGFPVLVSVPEIWSPQDLVRRRFKWKVTIATLVLTLVVGLGVFHFLIMDLDVFWAKVTRHLLKIM